MKDFYVQFEIVKPVEGGVAHRTGFMTWTMYYEWVAEGWSPLHCWDRTRLVRNKEGHLVQQQGSDCKQT